MPGTRPKHRETPMKWGSRALLVCLLAPPLAWSPLIRKQRLNKKQLYPTPLWGRRKQHLSSYPQSFNNSRASKSQVRSCFTVLGSWRSCSLPPQTQLPFPQSCSISNGKISNLRAQNTSAYCAIFLQCHRAAVSFWWTQSAHEADWFWLVGLH